MSWNHTRENHLSGAAFLSHTHSSAPGAASSVISSSEGLGRPTALICSSRTTDEEFFGANKWTRKRRDEALLEVIRTVAVGRGKVVLIPADSVARVLELVYLLEHAFRKDRHLSGGGEAGAGAGLYLVGRKARRLKDVVGSMLEWMDEGVIKELEGAAKIQQQQENSSQNQNRGGRNKGKGGKGGQQGAGGAGDGAGGGKQQKAAGPFDFLHLKILDKPLQVERLLKGHKAVETKDGDGGEDTGVNTSDNDSDNDTDASATSMDYDPETGALVERRKPPKSMKRKLGARQQKRLREEEARRKKDQSAKQLRGMVIIASDVSLEYGFSRDVFTKIAGGEGNVVVLTELMDGDGKGSLGEELSNAWREGMRQRKEKGGGAKEAGGIGVELGWEKKEVKMCDRTPLRGSEVENYRKYLSGLKKHSTSTGATTSTDGHPPPGHDGLPYVLPDDVDPDTSDSSSSDSESDSDPDKQGKSLANTTSKSKKALAAAAIKAAAAAAPGTQENKPLLPAATVADLGISVLLRGKGVYDFDVRSAKGRNRMLPFALKRRRGDEYGEVVKGEEYLRAEEREEQLIPSVAEDKLVASQAQQAAEKMRDRERVVERVMGRKRKWEEAGQGEAGSSVLGLKDGKGKRMQGGAGGTRKKKAMKRRKGNDSRQSSPGREGSSADDDDDEEGEVKEDSGAATPANPDDSDVSSEDDEDETETILTTPSKATTRTITIPLIRARIHYIDFSGLHDSRSLRMLLPLINPRKLILVSGTTSQIERMASECRELLSSASSSSRAGLGSIGPRGTDVFTPRIGEKVNASVDTNAWTVKLSERLVRGLRWQEVGGLGVVHVVGRVVISDKFVKMVAEKEKAGREQKLLLKGVEDGKKDGEGDTAMSGGGGKSDVEEEQVMDIDLLAPPQDDPKLPPRMLDAVIPVVTTTPAAAIAPASESGGILLRHLSTQPIHVGDVKLTDLRRVLAQAGHTAEFAGEGGALVCDGCVVVRKVGMGRVVVEDGGGGLFARGGGAAKNIRSFVEVRRRVYEGLAVVRGGV